MYSQISFFLTNRLWITGFTQEGKIKMYLLVTWEDRAWVHMLIWQWVSSPVTLHGCVAVRG